MSPRHDGGSRATGALVALFVAAVGGCAHGGAVVSQSLVDMERARLGPDVKDGAVLAPQQFAHAEAERAQARDADARGDHAAADLYSERAVVAYERAVVLARLARATTAGELARASVAKEEAEAQKLAASRVDFERTADATANELAVARDALAPSKVGPADATREKARLIAAHSLAAEGHLLCSAARLLAPAGTGATIDTTRLDAAEHEDDAVLAALSSAPKGRVPSPVEAASRARVSCLDALTRTRRAAAAGSGDTDSLMSALSARGGWDPSRDERGVIVTLRGAFKGDSLVPAAEKQLRELGRVAANRAPAPLQIVLHDAAPPSKAEETADHARVQAALTALGLGNGTSVATGVETVGAALPVADPSDPQGRARNARLEIVFIARSE